jgi:hypothetical protein
MKTKMLTAIFLTSMLALIWSSAAWAADRFNTRANRQTRRIHQGIRSGKITFPEARRLKREQLHIDCAYCRALADGHLNRHERRRLVKMRDRASRHIYRAKHNRARRHLQRHYHNGDHRAYYHRRGVVHNPNECHYYTATEPGYFDGYEFSAGVSDTGWQFAFSSRNSQ